VFCANFAGISLGRCIASFCFLVNCCSVVYLQCRVTFLFFDSRGCAWFAARYVANAGVVCMQATLLCALNASTVLACTEQYRLDVCNVCCAPDVFDG
jgi:hypothetical protein